jgi:hypothetical protein
MAKKIDPEEFWKEREEQFGGTVEMQTFARFMGNSNTEYQDLPGILYEINNMLVFEDFEKENWFLKLLQRESDYEKTEFRIPLDEIEVIQNVAKGHAMDSINGSIDSREIPPITRFKQILFGSVTQILMKNGISYFFEILNDKEFYQKIPPEMTAGR